MSKHTPGPWAYALEYGPSITELPRITTVARCANYVIGLPTDIPGGNYRDGDPSGDEEADARLIAAAPAMLDVLDAISQSAVYVANGECSVSYEIVRRVDAALRAAKGEA